MISGGQPKLTSSIYVTARDVIGQRAAFTSLLLRQQMVSLPNKERSGQFGSLLYDVHIESEHRIFCP